MVLSKSRYQGGTQHGGAGGGGTTEKMDYNPTFLQMMVAKTVDAGEAVAIPSDHPNREKLLELTKQVQ